MILMHQNTPVAEVFFENNRPVAFGTIYNRMEMPIGTLTNFKAQERILLTKWHESRSVPAVRRNFMAVEEKLGMDRAEMFLRSSGVSLTDTYWFKEPEDTVTWEDINFHDNDFSGVIANCLLNGDDAAFSKSPDFTTDGIMEKFWYSDHGVPYLAKLSSTTKKNEETLSANEIVYAKIAESVGINTTPYVMGTSSIGQFCTCPCFITASDQDFITALQLKYEDFKRTSEALLRYLMRQKGFEKEVREQITLDVILHNTDRHEKNIGIITNKKDTWFAPSFDNGYCLGAGMNVDSPIVDNNMKLFQDDRIGILERYAVPLDFDKAYCLSVIKNTYEQFHIPEERYERAKKEFKYGLELYANRDKSIYLSADTEYHYEN